MNKRGYAPIIIGIIIVFIIGWLIINNVYVQYKSLEMSSSYNKDNRWTCKDNILKEDTTITDWGLTGGDCFSNAEGWHKYKISCNNDTLMITCYKTIYNKYFRDK